MQTLPLLALATPALAQSGQLGNCVSDFLPPGAFCSAQDVQVVSLTPVQGPGACVVGSTVDVVLDVTLMSIAAERYDIGIFISTDGGNALSGGACYHDYLAPPLTTSPIPPVIRNGPWWDGEGDACGDIRRETDGGVPAELIVTERGPGTPLSLTCSDTNADGNLDVSVCVSWENNTSNVCNSLALAVPLSATRCGCEHVEVTGISVIAEVNEILVDGFEAPAP